MNKKDRAKMKRIEKIVLHCSLKVPMCATAREQTYFYAKMLKELKKEVLTENKSRGEKNE